jgi:hypothetical protein
MENTANLAPMRGNRTPSSSLFCGPAIDTVVCDCGNSDPRIVSSQLARRIHDYHPLVITPIRGHGRTHCYEDA